MYIEDKILLFSKYSTLITLRMRSDRFVYKNMASPECRTAFVVLTVVKLQPELETKLVHSNVKSIGPSLIDPS